MKKKFDILLRNRIYVELNPGIRLRGTRLRVMTDEGIETCDELIEFIQFQKRRFEENYPATKLPLIIKTTPCIIM